MEDKKKDARRRLLEAAVQPKGCGGPSPLERVLEIQRQPAVLPEWIYWPSRGEVFQWEAVALSLGLAPDSMQHSEGFISPASFPTKEIQVEFRKRLELVWRLTNQDKAPLEYFALLMKTLTMPLEMAAMASPALGAASINLPKEAASSGTIVSDSPQEKQAISGVDRNKPSSSRPPLQQHFQEIEILKVIKELGRDAKALPKDIPGKKGVKAEVRARLPNFSPNVFDKAWERLSNDKKIIKQK